MTDKTFGDGEGFVRGRLYVRSGGELTPKQLKSALDHLKKVPFDSASAALMQVPNSELSVTYQGRQRSGGVHLHRCATNVTADIDGHPVMATSFSYQFAQLFGFTPKTDARNARIIASQSRRLAVSADIYAVASDKREADSWKEAKFDEIADRDVFRVVNPKCYEQVTTGSSGNEHKWHVIRAARMAREHELKLLDDGSAREIIDKYQRTGLATAIEKAELRRIAGKVSIGELCSLEISYGRASIPTGEPSITVEQAAKLLD